MTTMVPSPRPLLLAYLAVVVVHVAAVAASADALATATKPFLVGLLLAWVLVSRTRPQPRLLVAGLALALLGDMLLEPSGTTWFLSGMAAFLAMQVCYIAGFLDLGARDRLRARRWTIAAWFVLWLVLNAVLGPSLGELRWPIAVYSVALVAMAATAVATGRWRLAVGGVVFLVSDLLIGLRAAEVAIPASGVLVMLTYVVAQYLIATGWVLALREADGGDAGEAAAALRPAA